MKMPNRILVANTSLRGLDAAISKAEMLEHYTGAEVEVAQVAWDAVEEEEDLLPIERANLISAFMAAERAALHDLMKPHINKVAWSEERVLWNKRADEAIADEVKSRKIDLLIKPAGESRKLDFVHAPFDWRLIRDNECPVLLSKSPSWTSGGNVLAAIDTTGKHDAINKEIVSTADFMARALGAKLHLLTVAPVPQHTLSSSLVTKMQERREAKLQTLAKLSNQDQVTLHVELGDPAGVISDQAKALGATVTVLGTHSRTGVGRWVLGNTAEKAISRITSDIVSIRAFCD